MLFARIERLGLAPTPEPASCYFADDVEDAWTHASLAAAGYKLFHPPCAIVYTSQIALSAHAIPDVLPDADIVAYRMRSKSRLLDGLWCGYFPMAAQCGVDAVTGVCSVPSTLGLVVARPGPEELQFKIGEEDDYASLQVRLQLRDGAAR
jgi:hypothetical protein